MRSFLGILALGRAKKLQFLVVAVLASLGTGAALFEPWIYRAIVDDIAGVFVPPAALARAERAAEEVASFAEHLVGSGGRIFHPPLRRFESPDRRRTLSSRTPREAVATVLVGALLLVLFRLAAEALRVTGDNRATVLANGIERDFIVRTFRHLLKLPVAFFTRRPSGAVVRQIDQSDQIAPVFNAVAQEIWPNFFTLVSILAILLSVNTELASLALIAVPAYALITWRMTRRLETEMDEYYQLWDEVSSRLQQAVSGIKTIQTLGTAGYEVEQFEKASGKAYSTYLARNRLQNRYTYLQEAVVALSRASVVALGGMKAIQHQLTPGDVVLFLSYLDLLYQPIQGLTEFYTSLQQNIGSVRRAQRLLATPEAAGEERILFEPKGGEVEFSDVHFGYDEGRPVLEGVTFRLRRGERVGLIGPSGAGKTTLTDLLVGLHHPRSGAIRVDGQSVAEVSPSSLRAAIRGVSADGMLFRATLRENIRYGRLTASDEEVGEAARLAGLGPLLERLPEGFETAVGERGVEMSLGERQRVLLARAFLSRPTVLILDEATANLDFKTEAAIKEALEQISQGRTCLVIAHRRSMLTRVNRVLVLRAGQIEQDGPPAQLLQQEGYYREMMLAQEGPVL